MFRSLPNGMALPEKMAFALLNSDCYHNKNKRRNHHGPERIDMTYRRLNLTIVLALALTAWADTTNNGTFEFLTESLPEGTTNGEYAARFVTANADGPVTFTALSALPAGLHLDPLSGFLTGIPTATFNNTITVAANDGTQQIQADVLLKINSSGGGGNG